MVIVTEDEPVCYVDPFPMITTPSCTQPLM